MEGASGPAASSASDSSSNLVFLFAVVNLVGYVMGQFLFLFVASRGWNGRVDILILLSIIWLIIVAVLQRLVILAKLIDARRPLWVRTMSDWLKNGTIVFSYFITFYVTDLMQSVDFKTLTTPEMIILLALGVFLMLGFQRFVEIFVGSIAGKSGKD